jgi:hypothetical protein
MLIRCDHVLRGTHKKRGGSQSPGEINHLSLTESTTEFRLEVTSGTFLTTVVITVTTTTGTFTTFTD